MCSIGLYDGLHELSPGPYLPERNSVYMKIFSIIRRRNLFPENLINKYISEYIQTAVKGGKTQLHSDHLETTNNCVFINRGYYMAARSISKRPSNVLFFI